MAVGKVFDYTVDIGDLAIYFGDARKGGRKIDAGTLDRDAVPLQRISEILKRNEVHVEIVLGNGPYSERVWGCDLTEGYIRENAYYTT